MTTERDTLTGLSRKETQDLFIRVCKDSGFKLDAFRAAALVGGILQTTPFVVYITMDIGLDTMRKIAAGTHPICTAAPFLLARIA